MTDTPKKPTDAELLKKIEALGGPQKTLAGEEIRQNIRALGYEMTDFPGAERHTIIARSDRAPSQNFKVVGKDLESANQKLHEAWGQKQEQIREIDQRHADEKRELEREIAKAEAEERERGDD